MSGRTALVTGACGILGQHFCRALADSGAGVVAVDLEEPAVSALAGDLQAEYGVPALGLVCDVSRPGDVAAMLSEASRQLGGLHVVVNNAASKTDDLEAFFAPTEDYSLESWREVMSVNLEGLFLVAQGAGRLMIEQGEGGTIIQIASIYGVVAPDDRIYEGSHYLGRQINTPPVYAASKAGVVGLTRYLAARWAPHGIRVNSLTPGGVRSGQNDAFVERYTARVPLQRMAEAEEMAGPLIFLASPASSYVTGQNIIVDGGLTAW